MSAYRTATTPPRFICVACYRTASAVEGMCSRCGSPRLSLDNAQVLEDVRKRAAEVKDKRDTRGAVLLGIPLLVLAVGLYLLLGWAGWIDIRPHSSTATWRFQIANVPALALCAVVALAVGVGVEVVRRKHRRTVERAPRDMNAEELVRFLGAQVEG